MISTVNRIVIAGRNEGSGHCQREVSGMYKTLGGRVECVQCDATSKRTGNRCLAPAIKGKTKCRFHGGKSTRARTAEGKAKIAKAHTVHGRETREKRRNNSVLMSQLRVTEQFMFELGMFPEGTARFACRKPLGHPVLTAQWDELRRLDVNDRQDAIRAILRSNIIGN